MISTAILLRAGAVLVLAMVVTSAPASAATTPDAPVGLVVTAGAEHVAVGEAISFRATVTNASGATCALPTTPEASLHISGLTRDGAPVEPDLTHAYYGAGIDQAVLTGMVPTEPGGAVDVQLTPHDLGDGTPLLTLPDVEALSSGDGIMALWPIDTPGRYELTLRYEAPLVESDPAVCAGSSSAVTAAFTVGDGPGAPTTESEPGLPWVPIAAGLALLSALAVAAWFLVRRRRHTRSPETMALVLALAAGWTVVAQPEPAEARVIVNETDAPGFSAAVDACLAELRDPARSTPETRRVVDWARDPSSPLIIVQPGDITMTSSTPDIGGPGETRGRSIVVWDPTPEFPHSPGIPADACSELFHELWHAMRIGQGADRPRWFCGAGDLRTEEVMATYAENRLRVARGLAPRTHYGRHPLPASLAECGPEPARGEEPAGSVTYRCDAAREIACAESNGDPHLTTWDGVKFSPQAVGEVVLVQDVPGAGRGATLAVQARQSPLGPSRRVSVNTAVAARVGADRVTLALEDANVVVRVDGEPRAMERGEQRLPGGGTLWRGRSSRAWAPDSYRVTWPDGSAVQVDPIGAAGLRLYLRLAGERRGAVHGLLGDADGSGVADLVARDGTVMTQPLTRASLYDELVDSWRVSPEESLFDYGPGEDTGAFTDRSFPDQVVTVQGLDIAARERAELACGLAGLVAGPLLDDCVLDVAMSGSVAFALAAGESQRDADGRTFGAGPPGPERHTFRDDATAVPLTGETAIVDLTRPGAAATVTFEAGADQVVLVELSGSTLPEGCGVVRLVDADGVTLRTGCLDDDGGLIDRTKLTAAGAHSVVVDPSGDGTGQVTLRVVVAVDDMRRSTVDGDAVAVVVGRPGAQARVAFDATKGQRVAVEIATTEDTMPLPSGCGQVRLIGPGGSPVRSGCLTDGVGRIDAVVLPADGRYSVLVDPSGTDIGAATVRVVGGG